MKIKTAMFSALAAGFISHSACIAAASSDLSLAQQLAAVQAQVAALALTNQTLNAELEASDALSGRLARKVDGLEGTLSTVRSNESVLRATNSVLRAQVDAMSKLSAFTPEAAALVAKRADSSSEEWRKIMHGELVSKVRSLELMATISTYADGFSVTQSFAKATSRLEREQLDELKRRAANLEKLARQIETAEKSGTPRVVDILRRRWDAATNEVMRLEIEVN